MPVTQTKEAGRAVQISTAAELLLKQNATADRAARIARAKAAADTLTPLGIATEQLPDPPALFSESEPTIAPALTLNAIHRKLCKPFAASLVELKPGAITQDKTRALGMPFVDSRAYQTRLDRVVSPEGWSVEYRPLSDRAVLCRLTILGVTREDVGECNASDENAATSAVAQSFKRACSAFGLGRYLYNLKQVWGEWNAQKKCFVDPTGVVAQMYASLPRGEE